MFNNYYVYAYLRQDDTPYYIGKGKEKRAWSKNHGNVMVPKDSTRIKFVKKNLTEDEAHNLEVSLIKQYGRKDLGTGILINQTNGGEGSSGRLLSEESLKKISNSVTIANQLGLCGFKRGHANKAGSIGGKSKSDKKISTSISNLEKTREIHKNSIWIYNPLTSSRKRIKENNLNDYLLQGWQKGFRA